jgi:DNA polymerase-3 subunit delta'
LAIAFSQFINCKNKTETDSCSTCPSCVKFKKFAHPDLHFYFPSTTTDSVKTEPRSELFLKEWRDYLAKSDAYPSQNGWYEHLGVGNKQGIINVRDAADIVQKMALKNFEADFKIIIIWMAEKMNSETSNKLLKTLEEPPDKTLIFLISERFELLIPTVRSRAQLMKILKLTEADIQNKLTRQFQITSEKATDIALLANGNLNLANEIYQNADETQANFINFRQWLRLCFRRDNILELNKFNTEIARLGREKQKSFFNYGLETVHYTIMHNMGHGDRIRKNDEELDFSSKLSPFFNDNNLTDIYNLLNEAIYHIERNAHTGIMLSDLSFKMSDLLAKGRK